MGDSQPDGTLDDSAAVQVTGRIMVIAIIVVFLVVVMVLFLHLYAKWFWWRVEELPPRATARRRPRRRFIFAPGQEGAAAAGRLRRGLDPSILQSIPIVVFRPEEFKDGLECAVCLSELIDGEKARLLPKCNHGFHVGCIDMWFQSHSTCPLCRNSVASVEQEDDSSVELEFESLDRSLEEARAQEISSDGHPSSTEPLNLPTNVLFWGNEARMSSSAGSPDEGSVPNGEPSSASSSSSSTRPALQGALVIDIPSQAIESTSSASGCMQDELKSPVTPRLKSFKRLLSRERRVSPCSPPSVDAEQAERSLPC